MYRIMFSSSGFYYVQEKNGWSSWTRVSDFYRSKQEARNFVYLRKGNCHCRPAPRPTHVVEYL